METKVVLYNLSPSIIIDRPANLPTLNGRIYPQELIENAIKEFQDKIHIYKNNILLERSNILLEVNHEDVQPVDIQVYNPFLTKIQDRRVNKAPSMFIPKITVCKHEFIPLLTSICCKHCGVDIKELKE